MDFVAAIRRETDRFYAVADEAEPSLPVPSCPGWSIADLVWHLGDVHCFWAIDVETRATSAEAVEAAQPARPDIEYPALIAWARAQAERLVAALDANDDATEVWTWALSDADHNVGFVRRHQVQEAAIHRWDIERAALGAADPIAPDIAVDAIDEFFGITIPWSVNPDKPAPGSLHVHCTDVDGEWFIHPDGTVERIHAKGDVAVRGAASDVLLALYKRLPVDDLDVIGDASIARRLVELANTE